VKEVQASTFKARCLQILDEVAATREPVVITKRGKPICQLTPYRPKPQTLFAMSKETMVVTGDIISPIDVEWEAQQ
jgi:prevent-host-death family protein